MSLTISTKTGTITTKRQVQNFTVATPPGKPASMIVIYTETDVDPEGVVLYERPGIASFGLTQEQLIALLPAGNQYGLPEFAALYAGLRALFDQQFAEKHPLLAPEN